MRLDLREQSRAYMPVLEAHPDLTESAVRTWHGRMVNEYASHRVFNELASQLQAAGLDAADVAKCREFAAEEKHHGVLCGAVVEALGGHAHAQLPEPPPFPAHSDVGPLEAALRNLLSISCLSETVAVSLIGAEREEMPEGPLRELLTEIYADECGHANFGWRLVGQLVPTLDAVAKQRLSAYLTVAFAHLEHHELGHLPLESQPPAHGVVLGLCSGAEARELFYATIESVIVPGLDALGLDGTGAWAGRQTVAAS